jgi:hypothetical protein
LAVAAIITVLSVWNRPSTEFYHQADVQSTCFRVLNALQPASIIGSASAGRQRRLVRQ